MAIAHQRFAENLVKDTLSLDESWCLDPECPRRILAQGQEERVGLDLTPFEARPQAATAADYFQDVDTLEALFTAYRKVRQMENFEDDCPSLHPNVHPYATEFLEILLREAKDSMTDADARRIAMWVEHFDLYVAVKAVESLLNSRVDVSLLEIAEAENWDLHFDHIAIPCGSARDHDAEDVAVLLRYRYDYCVSQIPEQQYYDFSNGWNAYPLYKILENGQVLRVLLYQSDDSRPEQITRHWNRVYGFTADHLAIRATRRVDGQRVTVALDELVGALRKRGGAVFSPTGHYTSGLLTQVFMRPERTPRLPAELKRELAAHGGNLETTIENGKLLELVSRREMSPERAHEFFALYGLTYEPANPLHSAPIYSYFLPLQTAQDANAFLGDQNKGWNATNAEPDCLGC